MYEHRMTYWARIGAFVLNIAMLLAALAIIGVAIWMNNDHSFDKDLKSVVFNYGSTGDLAYYKYQTRVWIIAVYWSIFGLAVGALVVAVLGIASSIRRGTCLLWGYLALMITLVLLEIGSAISIWVKRDQLRTLIRNLISSIFNTNDVSDMQIIQNTYNCCQTTLNNICIDKPQCTTTVFNSVDNTMMIAGIVLIPILILQIITIVLYAPIIIDRRKKVKFEQRDVSTSANLSSFTRF